MQRKMDRIEDRLQRRHFRSGGGGIVLGGLIVAVGLLILLDNMGIVRFHDIWEYWPVLLIVFGVSRILDSHSPAGYVWGGIVTLAGAFLLLDKLNIVVFDANLIWPLLIIAFGLSMLLRSLDRKRYLASATGATAPIDDSSSCNAYAVFGG